MVVTIGLLLVVGFALTALGLRGRRTDDHPLCRRCGFDLTGRAPDSMRCAECGAELIRPRATVVGHRRRRRVSLGLGLAVLAGTAAGIGVMRTERVRHINWMRYATVTYLTRAASSGNQGRMRPALGELALRATDGRLSPGQWDTVVAAGLRYQADLTKEWDMRWGDLIEGGRMAGRLTDAQWERYASRAWLTGFQVRVRARVRRGDPVPFEALEIVGRSSESFAMCVEPNESTGRFRWPASDLEFGTDGRNVGVVPIGPTEAGSFIPPEWVRAHLTDGPQNVCWTAAGTTPAEPPTGGATRGRQVSRRIDLPVQFTVLPPGEPSVGLVQGRPAADALRAMLRCGIEQSKRGDLEGFISIDGSLDGTVPALSFDVFLRTGDREERVGSWLCRPGWFGVNDGVHIASPMLAHDPLDVVFRTNRELATRTIDVFSVWQGELVYKDVRVKRDRD